MASLNSTSNITVPIGLVTSKAGTVNLIGSHDGVCVAFVGCNNPITGETDGGWTKQTTFSGGFEYGEIWTKPYTTSDTVVSGTWTCATNTVFIGNLIAINDVIESSYQVGTFVWANSVVGTPNTFTDPADSYDFGFEAVFYQVTSTSSAFGGVDIVNPADAEAASVTWPSSSTWFQNSSQGENYLFNVGYRSGGSSSSEDITYSYTGTPGASPGYSIIRVFFDAVPFSDAWAWGSGNAWGSID